MPSQSPINVDSPADRTEHLKCGRSNIYGIATDVCDLGRFRRGVPPRGLAQNLNEGVVIAGE
jgi:hypothetical protein